MEKSVPVFLFWKNDRRIRSSDLRSVKIKWKLCIFTNIKRLISICIYNKYMILF